MKTLVLLLLLVAVTAMAGCAAYPMNGATYANTAALRAQRTEVGTVVAVRRVALANRRNNDGGAIGAAVGGLAGSAVGTGIGRAIAVVAGVVGGTVAGSEAEKHITGRSPALQITVRGPHDGLHTVVQPDDGTRYKKGQQVLVIQGGGESRVSPYNI